MLKKSICYTLVVLFLTLSTGNAFGSLVGWWEFDETSGTTADDSTANNNDGTVTNATWITEGKYDGALDFDGTGDYVSVPAAAVSSVSTEISIAFWQYGASDINDNGGFAIQAINSGSFPLFSIYMTWLGDIYWDTMYDRTYHWASSDETEGGWHHWVFTKNSTTGTLKIYIDGVLTRTDSGSTSSISGVNAIKIGSDANGTNGYRGKLDDFRIYDNELSDDDVAQLYSNGSLQATIPLPSHKVAGADINVDLAWATGVNGVSHDVYFGTTSPGTSKGNQSGNTYEPGTLAHNTTYYWQIDEVDASSDKTTGDVWSFSTYPGSWPVGKYLKWGEQTIDQLEYDFKNPSTVYYYDSEAKLIDSYTWGLSTYVRTLASAYEKTGDTTWSALMEDVAIDCLDGYFDATKNGIGGYWLQPTSDGGSGNRLTDENALMSLAFMRAYEATSNNAYLTRAENAFDFVDFYTDSDLGGGAWWSENKNLKSGVTTHPMVVVALKLYNATSDPNYYNYASDMLTWTENNLWDSDLDLFNNSVNSDTSIDTTKWVYNQLVAMLAYLEFYDEDANSAHLDKAKTLAAGIEARWLNPVNSRINATNEFSYDIVETYGRLYEETGNERWLAVLTRALDYIHEKCRDSNGRYPHALNEVGDTPYTEWELHKIAVVQHMYWEAVMISAPGVVIIESDKATTVDEQGTTTDTYTVALNTLPSSSVTVTVDPDSQTEVNSNGAGNSINLTFTTSNWSTAQTVTVKAISDSTDEGYHNSVITHTVSSSDSDYNSVGIENVTVGVTDDDDANLKGWWAFEDGSGTSAADSSSANDDGTLSGATWTAGQTGGALDFDGTNDYVSVANADVSSSPLTVCAWIRADQWESSYALGVIVAKLDWASGANGYCLRTGSNGTLSFLIGTGAAWAEAMSTAIMNANEWYHIAATYDESNLRIYINGDEKDSTASTSAIAASPYNLTIGRSAYDVTRLFDGQIDDVRVYNTALSASDIQDIYYAAWDKRPPTPDYATFATAPNATGSSSIVMTATTGSDDTGSVEYYFDEISGNSGGTDSGWQTSTSYTDTGLAGGTTYTYTVKMRDSVGNTGGASPGVSAATNAADTTAPTPNPATFATAPYATGATSIAMVATTGSDATGPVEYYFDETSGNAGGTDSGWQTSASYTDTGLSENTTYTYTVQMRDSASTPNVGTASSGSNATTYATQTYNFVGVTRSSDDHFAIAMDVDVFPFGGNSANRNADYEPTDAGYAAFDADDTNQWATIDPAATDEIFLWLKFDLDQTASDIVQIDLTFNGNSDGRGATEHKIYVMDYDETWHENVAWDQVGTGLSITQDVDTEMTRSITSNFADYVESTGYITWGVYQSNRSSEDLRVNYIEVKVTYTP